MSLHVSSLQNKDARSNTLFSLLGNTKFDKSMTSSYMTRLKLRQVQLGSEPKMCHLKKCEAHRLYETCACHDQTVESNWKKRCMCMCLWMRRIDSHHSLSTEWCGELQGNISKRWIALLLLFSSCYCVIQGVFTQAESQWEKEKNASCASPCQPALSLHRGKCNWRRMMLSIDPLAMPQVCPLFDRIWQHNAGSRAVTREGLCVPLIKSKW